MSKYINPFTDWGFKYIFGQEDSKEILMAFLNELLKGERVITELSFMDKEQVPDNPTDRTSIFDIYCVTDTGERIIVEMQKRNQIHFKDRALYYMSKAIVMQGKKGVNWNFEYNAVYGVFFMDFCLPDTKKFRTDVVLADSETGEQFSDKMKQIFLSLPLFNTDKFSDCKSGFEKWIYILKQLPMIDIMPYFKEQEAIFNKLAKKAETGALSKEDRERYEYSLKIAQDNYAVMDYALKENEAKVWAEANAKIARIEENRLQEKLETARSLKALGLTVPVIAATLKLTEEDVLKALN